MIQRSGPTPFYGEYITDFALVPLDQAPSAELLSLAEGGLSWIDVPSFQRGIAWFLDDVLELASSNSTLLGNVILGQFPRLAGMFPMLPANVREYCLLVDGLQRFSVGTAIFSALYHSVMRTGCEFPHASSHFSPVSVRYLSKSPVFLHNDHELRNHRRWAVAESYIRLKNELTTHFKEEFAAGNAEKVSAYINRLCLKRQVAVDLYFNFPTTIELTHTFIGLNTVRVDLGAVDLVRSYIVDRALQTSWAMNDIEDIENQITKTFCGKEGKPKSTLLPFVGIVQNLLETENCEKFVLPTWPTGLTKADVVRFLDFVERLEEGIEKNPYSCEIAEIGTIPVAGLIAYYYRLYLDTGNLPSFVSGGHSEDLELHKYLVATLRILLEGQIGRSRPYSEKLMKGDYKELAKAAEDLSFAYASTSLNDPLSLDLLRSRLRNIDQKRAQRVFNAARLPKRGMPWGGGFPRDSYGTKTKEMHIDHLVPKSSMTLNAPGASEMETLVNFAPLPSGQNVEAKASHCSDKLDSGGVYSKYISLDPNAHPYCKWLLDVQGPLGCALDEQANLERNQKPAIGDDRLEWLAKWLQERI